MDRADLGCERIDMGAYEAALCADFYLRHCTELFLQGPRGLLVCKAARDPFGAYFDSRSILHL